MGMVTGIFIYPVKSMRRVGVQECHVEKRGLRGDRRWVVTDNEGKFQTQRDLHLLATLRAENKGDDLHLTAQGAKAILVRRPQGPPLSVNVWNDTVDALDAGQEVADWLTSVLGVESRLAYMPENSIRPTASEFSQVGDHVSFADGFPLLLANQATLDDLNDHLKEPVSITRFRPNVVVAGFDALAEDDWKRVQIGGVSFRSPKLCGRCIVTTIDQDTGIRHGGEPLETLTKYRLKGQAAIFGINLIPDNAGTIRVGDTVEARL